MNSFEKYKKEFSSFIKNFKKEDNIAIFHDTDGDGICSATITTKALEKLGYKIKLDISIGSDEIDFTKKTVEVLKQHNITKLIVLDKPVERGLDNLNKITKFADILIIDHHKIENEIKNKKILFIKPQFFSEISPDKYPTTKLTYDFFSELTNIEEIDWIATAGTMSDAGDDIWKKFIQKVMKKYNFKGDPWKSTLGLIVGYISNTAAYSKKGPHRTLQTLLDSKDYKQFLNSGLKKYYDVVDEEIQKYIKEVKTKGEFINDIIFYKYNPKYSISSILSTVISIHQYPNKTFILILDREEGIIKLSLRRNDHKKDMAVLIKKAIEGFKEAKGGGHKPAAGGRILKKDLEEFKKRIIKINSKL